MLGKFTKLKSIPIMTQNKIFVNAQNSVLQGLNESNIDEWLTLNKYGLKTNKPQYLEDVIKRLESVGNFKLANYIKKRESENSLS